MENEFTSLYKLHWSQLPSEESKLNKSVLFKADNGDKVNIEMANKINSAYANTYGSRIRPESVAEIRDCLVDVINEILIDFPENDSRKIRYKNAIDKSKL